jgi:hypothetical protein
MPSQTNNQALKSINKKHLTITLKQAEIEQLKAYKVTLINSVMNGKIKIPDETLSLP